MNWRRCCAARHQKRANASSSRRTTSTWRSGSATPQRSSTPPHCTACRRPTWRRAPYPAGWHAGAGISFDPATLTIRLSQKIGISNIFRQFLLQLTFLFTFAPLKSPPFGVCDSGIGPFVYRLGRKIFILERGVRLSYGLRTRRAAERHGTGGELPTGNRDSKTQASTGEYFSRSGLQAYPHTATAGTDLATEKKVKIKTQNYGKP